MYYHMLYHRIYGLPYVIYDVFGLPYGLPLPMISTGSREISYVFPYGLHGNTYGITYDFRGSVSCTQIVLELIHLVLCHHNP